MFVGGVQRFPSITRSADNTVVNLSTALAAGAIVSINATSALTDFAGNPLVPFASSFTVVAPIDVGRPSISAVRPGSGATRVAADTSVVLYANEALDAASVNTGLFVSADGALVTGTVSMAAGAGTVEFVPDAPFAPNAFVQVFATTDIQDLDGNAMNNFAATFRIVPDSSTLNAFVQDLSPFSGASNVPTNAALEALYSEPLNPAAVTATNVRVFPSGLPEATGTRTLINGGRTIRFVPDVPFAANTFHSWQITSQGLDDVSPVFTMSASFTIGADADVTAPTIVSVTPVDGATNVGVASTVSVVFDEPINPLSVSGSTMELVGPGGTVLPCTISFSNSDQTVIITPHSPLFDSAVHTLTVNGVTDRAGNPAAVNVSQFTTGVGP